LSKEILSGTIKKESVVGITLDKDQQFHFMNIDDIKID
jgi:hypothetical protein